MIRKLLVLVVLLSLVVGTSLSADPIGLTVGVDAFGFGDVAHDDWAFSGTKGQGYIDPYVKFQTAPLEELTLFAEVYYRLKFKDPSASSLEPKIRVTYDIIPKELNVWLSDEIQIKEADGTWNYKDDRDESTLKNLAELGLRYTLGLDFGDLYFQAEPGVYTQGKLLTIGAFAENDGFKIGVAKVAGGLYGYVQPFFQFYATDDGEKVEDLDILYDLNIRVGYKTGPLDARVTVTIPTGSSDDKGGIAERGLTIRPRVTYTIMEGLDVYGDVALGAIGGDEDKGAGDHVTVKPSIGVGYSF
ncbi:hypothetical protein FACS1894200_11100 [Spirochaetia bacterium]|nr:hypothetical protein FACS1894200_11100 [Spirochaetia bacterium]